MKFTFIANASGVFTGSEGTTLLMDPWLDDGVFEGSWCHYPPLKTKHKNLQDVTAIFISHIHPDHYDERFFDYPKNTPIFILDSKFNFLLKALQKKGYTNIIALHESKSHQFNEFTITLFSPFTSNVFHESQAGNLIDSAIVLQDRDGTSAFNANDNTPDIKSCELLRRDFGTFDLVMLNYNAAGPYPSCFRNLNKEEKLKSHKKTIERNIRHLIKCCDALNPRAVLPFAGSYVIGGKEHNKNSVLGTTTWDYCAKSIMKKSPHLAITLNEGQTVNLDSLKINGTYEPINLEKQAEYIKTVLSKLKYPYELDPEVKKEDLDEKINSSIIALNKRQQKYGLTVKSTIFIQTEHGRHMIHHGDESQMIKLEFYLDSRLLNRIMEKKSHWNNAEIGCHIEINREPDIYEIDAHTLMQFFHM